MTHEEIFFKKADYEKLRFDFSIIPPGGSILKFYSGSLGACPEFTEPNEIPYKDKDGKLERKVLLSDFREQCIRYVAILYDKNSKFNVRHDPHKMRMYAAICAGWKPDEKGVFADDVQCILNGRSSAVNRMALRYCKYFHSILYTNLVTTIIAWYSAADQLVAEGGTGRSAFSDEVNKGKIYEHYKKLGDDIEEMIGKFVAEDTNIHMRTELFCLVEDEIKNDLTLSPEIIAAGGNQ